MSFADKIFIDMCRDIIENGCSTEGEKVRPHWEDGTLAYTVKKFGVVNRYDLLKRNFRRSLCRTGLKSCFDELLWIWQKNPIISMIWGPESGTAGQMKMDPSERLTVISFR